MLRLEPTGTGRNNLLQMLQTICPEANLTVDPDGTVVVQNAAACSPESALQSCRCICEAVEIDRTATIKLDARQARYGGGGLTVDAVEDDTANGVGSDETIYVDDRGAFAPHPDWIVLAHELCGHALPGMLGRHPEWRPGRSGFDPNWHQHAIDAENVVRAERGLPPR